MMPKAPSKLTPQKLIAIALASAGFVMAPAARGDVCVPGTSSNAALLAEGKRSLGEQALAVARLASESDPARVTELAKAEQYFREAVAATICLIPLNAVRLGQVLDLEGRPLSAAEAYELVIEQRSKVAKYRIYAEPLALATQGAEAERKRVARFEVFVVATRCDDAVVLIDGEPAPVGPHDRNPGVVKLEASARGCVTQAMSYVLHDGANRRVQFMLSPPPDPPQEPLSNGCRGVFCPRWLWLSIGGAALAAGGGYLGYRAFSHDNQPDVPSGTLGRVTLR